MAMRWWMAQDVMVKFSTLVFILSVPVVAWLIYVSNFWTPH